MDFDFFVEFHAVCKSSTADALSCHMEDADISSVSMPELGFFVLLDLDLLTVLSCNILVEGSKALEFMLFITSFIEVSKTLTIGTIGLR